MPDNLAGRKVRCPKCRGVADVIPMAAASRPAALTAPAMAAESKASPRRPESEEVRVRARKPIPEPDVEDAEEVEDRPSKPVRSPSRSRQEAISTRPIRRSETTDEEEEDDSPRPRRFKPRKRKRTSKSILPAGWGFIRWVAVTLVYLMIATGYAAYMLTHDHAGELVFNAVFWGIMMPVSLVIFVASMFIGSAIAGGIDFGDAFVAIPKALFLLAPINFIYVVLPGMISFFVALPFWIAGLILLYGLDVWEAKFIIIINWLLGKGAGILIVLMVGAFIYGQMSKDLDKGSADDPTDDQTVVPAQRDMPKLPTRVPRMPR